MRSRRVTLLKYIQISGYELERYLPTDPKYGAFLQMRVARTVGDSIAELLLDSALDLDDPVFFHIGEATDADAITDGPLNYRYAMGDRTVEILITYGDKRPRDVVDKKINETKQRGRPQIPRRPANLPEHPLVGRGGPGALTQ